MGLQSVVLSIVLAEGKPVAAASGASVCRPKFEANSLNAISPFIHQFGHIENLRELFAAHGLPTISVDTNKKELIGNFKNNGQAWQQEATEVYDHDFPTHAVGKAVPYGIYDTKRNTGTVFVGHSSDTPSFAVECIEKVWVKYGKAQYPEGKSLSLSPWFIKMESNRA